MGSNQKQNDSENVKIIIGKLLDKAAISIRPVISAFDSVQARSAIIKRLDQFTVPLLESCAEFLGIALSDQKGFKIFAKPALMDRVYFGFRALLPAKCKECSEDYVIDHEPEVPPFFNCFRCFKGSHDCERNSLLHETLSKMNTPAGFVWLCDKCHDIVDPIEPRKHKSRHNSGTLPAGNHSSDSSNELSSIAFQNALSSTQRPPSQNTPEKHAAPPNETCQNFLNWNCPHGMSGKKEVSGKCCSSIHTRVCNQFRMSGTTGRKGCKKGMNCPFFHPKICKTALDSGSCSKKDCSSFHPRSARKKNNNNDNNPNSAPRKAKQKQKGANQNDSYSKSSNFLELRNLVTGMATKLEAMEKKMSQGAPACQPVTQPTSSLQALPTMMYPAPAPQPMMSLGVPRLPPHPMPYSHHSFY